MRCEDIRSIRVRALAGEATDEETAAADAHAVSCVACRSQASDVETIWSALGDWEVAAAPADAAARLLSCIDAQGRNAPGPRPRRMWPAVAAAAVAGVLVGLVLPRPEGPAVALTSAAADGSAYLLLLRRGPDATTPDAGPVFDRIVAEYSDWRAGLVERGALIGSNLLDAATGVELRGELSGVTVTHGVPRSATGEYVSGYYLVAAPDLSSARELARTSPHLRYGGSIELRPVAVPPGSEAP